MKFKRKIFPDTKSLSNFITKKRLKEDEINFTKLRSYRLDRVKKELEKKTLSSGIVYNQKMLVSLKACKKEEIHLPIMGVIFLQLWMLLHINFINGFQKIYYNK